MWSQSCDILNPYEALKEPDERKPLTNGDRIRAMSDEELCKFLGECSFCDICNEGCDNCTYHGDCDKRLLEWLKQPAKIELQDVVDLDKQTRDNNAAMREVMDFITGGV